jgi:hypothetical protein
MRFIVGFLIYRPKSSIGERVSIIEERNLSSPGVHGSEGVIPANKLRMLSGNIVIAKIDAVSVYFPDDRKIVLKRFTLLDIKPLSAFDLDCEWDLYFESDTWE